MELKLTFKSYPSSSGHRGRPGLQGGSLPSDSNQVVGKITWGGNVPYSLPIYLITDASKLVTDYSLVVVSIKENKVYAVKGNANELEHRDMITIVEPGTTEDDYVRFVCNYLPRLTVNIDSAGVPFDSWELDNKTLINKAMRNIYKALDKLVAKGLPADTLVDVDMVYKRDTITIRAKEHHVIHLKSYPASSGHRGIPGHQGGSLPGDANQDNNQVVGSIDNGTSKGIDVYEITDASRLIADYDLVAVSRNSNKIYGCKSQKYATSIFITHGNVIYAVDPTQNEDDYVRFRIWKGSLSIDIDSAGYVVRKGNTADKNKAIDSIYKALDKLVAAGLPKDTPVTISDFFDEWPPIHITAKEFKSYPASSGHRGIPGHRGGSLPSNQSGMRPANSAGKDTMGMYMNPDGTWTKERQALHDEIIASFFQGKTPVENPTSFVLGGAGAVGKSTLVHYGKSGIPKNSVVADADAIKSLLPEYDEGDATGGEAAFVHEESSFLSKEIAARAARENYNTVLDGTGNGTIENLSKKVNALRANGQPVIGIYVTCDYDIALERSKVRFEQTGRIVPAAHFKATHVRISTVFPDIAKAGLYDSLSLYDTSSGSAVLIGKGGKLGFDVIDDAAYARFLSKASL